MTSLIIIMKANRIIPKLALDKYKPALRFSTDIKQAELQTEKSSQKQKDFTIVKLPIKVNPLPIINLTKGQNYFPTNSRFSSLNSHISDSSSQTKNGDSYLIGDIQFIKSKLTFLNKRPQSKQDQQLRRLCRIKKIGRLLSISQHRMNIQKTTSLGAAIYKTDAKRREGTLSLSHNFEYKIQSSAKYSNKFDLIPMQINKENVQNIPKNKIPTIPSQKKGTLQIINRQTEKHIKSFQQLKTYKTLKDKTDNPHKSNKHVLIHEKNNIKQSISTAVFLKKHYEAKMKELEDKEQHLREKQNDLLERISHLKSLEEKYYCISSQKESKANMEIFKNYKRLENQFIQMKNLTKNKLRLKIEVQLLDKFQKIKEGGLQQLDKASKDEEIISNPHILIKHLRYIIDQTHHQYISALKQVQQCNNDLQQKITHWAHLLISRRNLLEDNYRQFICVNTLFNTKMKKVENIDQNDQEMNEWHELMQLHAELQRKYKIYLTFI